MYDKLFQLTIAIGGAIITYWLADKGTKLLTGKHIHEHALDCFPEFKKRIEVWCSETTEKVEVHLQLLKDNGSVQGKRVLRAIGLRNDLKQLPVVITEEVISFEQARQLGFDLTLNVDQELAYVMA